MTDDIAFLSATELLARYRTKALSPVEVMTETLRRLEKYEAAVNAFVLYDPDSALAEARASETRWRRGEPQGLLDGLPIALKDTLLTRGWPRLVGSRTIEYRSTSSFLSGPRTRQRASSSTSAPSTPSKRTMSTTI